MINFTLIKSANQNQTEGKKEYLVFKEYISAGWATLNAALLKCLYNIFIITLFDIRPLSVRTKSLWLWYHDKKMCCLRQQGNVVTVVCVS